ncbi:hypothetical protein Tco_0069173, partial [Tanacetum coccineum]
ADLGTMGRHSNHEGKCTKDEEEDSNKALAVSFYPRTEPVELLEWKAPKNRLKPSSVEPPKLELKELPEHLEYAFLQENNQLPVVISSALSTDKKTRLLKVLRNHKGVIPKKGGMTVVKNEKDELIPQWTITGWSMFASADSIKLFLLVVQVTFMLIMFLLDMFSFLLTEIESADY